MPRYLTKSRFKLALECPTKLFYTGKKDYANKTLEDPFLASLAEGGFQVGELAKYYFQNGYQIKTSDFEKSLEETNALLNNKRAVIFEAAVLWNSLFIRVDILIKDDDTIYFYEVKAKSCDSSESNIFCSDKGTIRSEWEPYLHDVAFQKYVLCKAFPSMNVNANLMLVDKQAVCSTDGLNQKFRITKDDYGRRSIHVVDDITSADLSVPLLYKLNVDTLCDRIYKEPDKNSHLSKPFTEQINFYAQNYDLDTRIDMPISPACATCEFCATEEEEHNGLRHGKKECWKRQLGWTEEDFKAQTVLDIWNFRKKNKLLSEGIIKLDDVSEKDIAPTSDSLAGISPTERQWLQISKYQRRDNEQWLDIENLRKEMSRWVFPLHFIDFETSMVAIPFNSGRHPYEGIAFQFSHHTVSETGLVCHAGQYLNTAQGVFPNYDFIRSLKKELEQDEGSIFRYSNHENTYLNIIYRQLQEERNSIPDRDELCAFIRSITHSGRDSTEKWQGKRDMLDLWHFVKRYYYDPSTKGSNSIKQVLPAILNRSTYLKEKYSLPIYGAEDGIKSLNYTNWQWITFDSNGKVIDPYKILPKMFQDVSKKDLELLSADDLVNNGGAALTAYARMQFEEMTLYEQQEIQKALLKYCELDTLAMVMIYEGWREMCK